MKKIVIDSANLNPKIETVSNLTALKGGKDSERFFLKEGVELNQAELNDEEFKRLLSMGDIVLLGDSLRAEYSTKNEPVEDNY